MTLGTMLTEYNTRSEILEQDLRNYCPLLNWWVSRITSEHYFQDDHVRALVIQDVIEVRCRLDIFGPGGRIIPIHCLKSYTRRMLDTFNGHVLTMIVEEILDSINHTMMGWRLPQ